MEKRHKYNRERVVEDNFIHDRNLKGGYASPKIKGGIATKDFFKFYKKQGGQLDRSPFTSILRECNKMVVEELLISAEDFTLPYGMGKIGFRKRKNKAFLRDGKVMSNQVVDWKKTMDAWVANPQARRNKVLIKYSNMDTGRYSFRVAMFERRYKNKEYFAFSYKRSFKRQFAKRINTYELPKLHVKIQKTI